MFLRNGFFIETDVQGVSWYGTMLVSMFRNDWAFGDLQQKLDVDCVDHSWTCGWNAMTSAARAKRGRSSRTPVAKRNREDSRKQHPSRLRDADVASSNAASSRGGCSAGGCQSTSDALSDGNPRPASAKRRLSTAGLESRWSTTRTRQYAADTWAYRNGQQVSAKSLVFVSGNRDH